MKQLWDIALAEAIKHKANIVQFWNGENDAQAAYRTNGAVIGLNWDSTGYNLRKTASASSRRRKAPSPGTRASC